jgi:hypothetical protein
MPNDPQDEGIIETSQGELPEPTRPPEGPVALDDAPQTPALSDEELRERQEAMGTRRKPAGPPLGPGPAGDLEALDQGADVPETDVIDAQVIDTDEGEGSPGPLDSSEPE